MNRTQRRQLGKENKERTYIFSESQMQKHIMTELEAIKKDATISADAHDKTRFADVYHKR